MTLSSHVHWRLKRDYFKHRSVVSASQSESLKQRTGFSLYYCLGTVIGHVSSSVQKFSFLILN